MRGVPLIWSNQASEDYLRNSGSKVARLLLWVDYGEVVSEVVSEGRISE